MKHIDTNQILATIAQRKSEGVRRAAKFNQKRRESTTKKRKSLQESFIASLTPGVCWDWLGTINGQGYGTKQFSLKRWVAHRLVYSLMVGELPPFRYNGLQLDHLCRNRACVRPSHMELVPQKTNLYRGSGWVGRNARKTHCLNGHPFDEFNTLVVSGSRRRCRQCHANAAAKYQAKRRGGPPHVPIKRK